MLGRELRDQGGGSARIAWDDQEGLLGEVTFTSENRGESSGDGGRRPSEWRRTQEVRCADVKEDAEGRAKGGLG